MVKRRLRSGNNGDFRAAGRRYFLMRRRYLTVAILADFWHTFFAYCFLKRIKELLIGEDGAMVKKIGLLGVMFAVFLFVTGCGQEIKKENEQLKAQVASMTERNTALATQVAAFEKDTADLKAQVANLTAERDAARKELEALKAKMKTKTSAKATTKKSSSKKKKKKK
ncbi:MAG: hypothetical protein A3J24_10435 [Deltaproteobacteria bacterium RIFCSPLOWO2_02_FULL_53_8]|nr:MAG: hypothetical protein A3J24_10435 [Deltaproteobacteria bacterium RIFCSPLOWO2_02_FULL_53_8]